MLTELKNGVPNSIVASNHIRAFSEGHLTSESGVQQGDPLGPLFFSLVLHKAIAAIDVDDDCLRLILQACGFCKIVHLARSTPPSVAADSLKIMDSDVNLVTHFDPSKFHTAISWWLGLETTRASSCCLLCPEIALDPLGHHALSCRRGGDVVLRHNQLHDIFVDFCHKTNLSVKVEAGSTLTPDLSRSCPMDALVSNCVTSGSKCHTWNCCTTGRERKHQANDPKCHMLGWKCTSLAVESHGSWGSEVRQVFSHLASRLSFGLGIQKPKILVETYWKLNIALVRSLCQHIWQTANCDFCHKTNLSVKVEAGSTLTPDLSRSCPMDALVSNWSDGIPTAFDITVTSPLTPVSLQEASVTPGTAALLAERRKHQANDPKCHMLGWKCTPLAVESYGSWGIQKPKILVELYGKSAKPAFAKALSSTLRAVIETNTEQAWLKLLMLPKCVLRSVKRSGNHTQPHPVDTLCRRWLDNEVESLWSMAKSREVKSKGVAPNNESTWQQLKAKHPNNPTPVAPDILSDPIFLKADFDILSVLRSFPKGTATGSSGLRVLHLLDVTAIPLYTPICTSLRCLVNLLAGARAPPSISKFLAGGNLVALNKTTEASKSDIRPIAVGETLRRLTAKCLCITIREKARDLFQPLQVGVACRSGSERIIRGLRKCIDDHWDDDDFVVFKVDMRNAFNMVSRQAILDECATFFPEILPWVVWCYWTHPLLWHPQGQLCSELGVQQGDPLGPLLFSLVLQKLEASIDADDECIDLLLHAWYLDDGVLAGNRLAVSRAFFLIQGLGPALGFHINLGKCELFARRGDTLFPSAIPCSTLPNLVILGAPVGDYIHCSRYSSGERGGGHDHTRPADVLIAGWDRGKHAALDITMASPLCPAILPEASHHSGAAANGAELRKLNANSTKCTELGWTCIPMAVETFGHWGREAQSVLSRLASHLSISLSQPRAAVVADIYGRLNIILVRSVSRAILSRLPQSG
eukprot:Em0311g4a